jgi:hypothetical protein
VDRGKPGIAGGDDVSAGGFQVGEERADCRRVEVGEVQLAGLLAVLLAGEGEQQLGILRQVVADIRRARPSIRRTRASRARGL